jgi:hypothetical protein
MASIAGWGRRRQGIIIINVVRPSCGAAGLGGRPGQVPASRRAGCERDGAPVSQARPSLRLVATESAGGDGTRDVHGLGRGGDGSLERGHALDQQQPSKRGKHKGTIGHATILTVEMVAVTPYRLGRASPAQQRRWEVQLAGGHAKSRRNAQHQIKRSRAC